MMIRRVVAAALCALVVSCGQGEFVKGNEPPVVLNLSVFGAPGESVPLSGSYIYDDVDGDPEGESLVQWFRGDLSTPIDGATTLDYTPGEDDVGAQLFFTVRPVAESGTTHGLLASMPLSLVAAGAAPMASDVDVVGDPLAGEALTASYTYADAEGDVEGATTFRWLRGGSLIAGATSSSYALVDDDEGFVIAVEVTPVAQTGSVSVGDPVLSPARLVVGIEQSTVVGSATRAEGLVDEDVVGAVVVRVEANDLDPSWEITTVLTDGVESTTLGPITGADGATFDHVSTDLSAFADGVIAVTTSVSDEEVTEVVTSTIVKNTKTEPTVAFLVDSDAGAIEQRWITDSGARLVPNGVHVVGSHPIRAEVSGSGRVLMVIDDVDGTLTSHAILTSGTLEATDSETCTGTPNALCCDPSGRFVFVATDAVTPITSYSIDSSLGALSKVGDFGPPGSTGLVDELCIDPSGSRLYAVSTTGELWVYDVDLMTGALSGLAALSSGFGSLHGTPLVHPSGEHVFVPYESGSGGGVTRFDVDETGAVEMSAFDFGVEVPAWLAQSSDGDQLYVASPALALMRVLDFDHVSKAFVGISSPLGSTADQLVMLAGGAALLGVSFSGGATLNRWARAGDGSLTSESDLRAAFDDPQWIALGSATTPLAPDLVSVYTTNDNGGEVDAFTFEALSFTHVGGASLTAGTAPQAITTHPSGRWVFVGGDGELRSLAVDPVTHALTASTTLSLPTNAVVSALGVDPSGRYLVAADAGLDRVRSYSIDLATGVLTASDDIACGDDAIDLDFHPSGRWVYVVSRQARELLTAHLDLADGSLTSVAALSTPLFPTRLTVHDVDHRAYVGRSNGVANADTTLGQVGVYSIDATTGVLADSGAAVSIDVQPIFGVSVSSDGERIIAFDNSQSVGDSAVETYSIDHGTGALSLIGTHYAAALRTDRVVRIPGSSHFFITDPNLDQLALLMVSTLGTSSAKISTGVAGDASSVAGLLELFDD